MKVILLEDVNKVGKKGDLVELSDGYARNVILSKKKGIEATPAAINNLKLQKANDAKIAAKQLEDAKQLAKEMEEMTVHLKIKTGEGGRSFGAISNKEIAQALKDEYQIEVDKKKIILDNPIKSIGSFDVKVKLHTQVTAELKVHVDELK